MRRKIRQDFPGVPEITTVELAELLSDDSSAKLTLVDVRKKEEFEVSHLPNAIHIADHDELLKRFANTDADSTIQDPDPMIVIYCSVGYRSARATQKLLAAGVKGVVNLDGSIFQWVNEGRTVYRDEEPVTEVHPFSKFWSLLLKLKSKRKRIH